MLTAGFDDFNVGYIAPVLESVFSEMGGAMSGKVKVRGQMDNISLRGEGTRFDNALLRVGFTNVAYYLNGPFSVTDQGLFFDGIPSRTVQRHRQHRRGPAVRPPEEHQDGHQDQDERHRGHRHGRGRRQGLLWPPVRQRGCLDQRPVQRSLIDVNARTDKNGHIHIPIDNASNDGKNDLLTFRQAFREVYEDPYEAMMNNMAAGAGKGSDFGIRLRVNATQGHRGLCRDRQGCRQCAERPGQGIIDIEVRPGRDLFTINGDYALRSGNFQFNAMDIAKRDFTISDGSTVRFNGDVMDSDLDIKGIYSTKASVATLLADTTSVSARRTVNCGIGVSGKLREPKLSFSIDVPDLTQPPSQGWRAP